ncbi:hypothetical protein Tco_0592641 [Tanacetum coccineum]
MILTPPNEGHMKSSKNVEPRLRKNTVVNKDEEYDKPIFEPNVKDDGLEELDTTETEGKIVIDEVELRMSPKSEILINSESENGNTSQSFLQVDHSSIAKLPATVTSPFPVSPSSWNLQSTEADAVRMRKK